MLTFIQKLLKYVFYYVLLLFVIGYGLELIIYYNTKNKQYALQADWDNKIQENYDNLFVGNSRLWVQLDLKSFNQQTNVKSYALSQDGGKVDVLWSKFKVYLKNNRAPRRIFLQFDPYFLSYLNKNTFYGKENYLSYIFFDRLGINKLFYGLVGFNYYEVYLPIIRYWGFSEVSKEHVFGKILKKDDFWKNPKTFKYGTNPQNWHWAQFSDTKTWQNPELTNKPMDLTYVDSFRNYCNKNHVNLTLYYPPQSWLSYQKVDIKLKKELMEYAYKNKLIYWNFNNPNYNDSALFYNHMHMNKKGTERFTLELIRRYNNNLLIQ